MEDGKNINKILRIILPFPCATPVLVVLLGLVAKGDNVLWGILLIAFYMFYLGF